MGGRVNPSVAKREIKTNVSPPFVRPSHRPSVRRVRRWSPADVTSGVPVDDDDDDDNDEDGGGGDGSGGGGDDDDVSMLISPTHTHTTSLSPEAWS